MAQNGLSVPLTLPVFLRYLTLAGWQLVTRELGVGDKTFGWALEGSSSRSWCVQQVGGTYYLYDLEQSTKLQTLSFSVQWE